MEKINEEPKYVWHVVALDTQESIDENVPRLIVHIEKKFYRTKKGCCDYIEKHKNKYYDNRPRRELRSFSEMYQVLKIDISKLSNYQNVFKECKRKRHWYEEDNTCRI